MTAPAGALPVAVTGPFGGIHDMCVLTLRGVRSGVTCSGLLTMIANPVVFFCGVDALDDMSWMEARPGRTERELERTRRALFYVGATRAMVRQYVSGLAGARFTRAALEYARALARGSR